MYRAYETYDNAKCRKKVFIVHFLFFAVIARVIRDTCSSIKRLTRDVRANILI